MTVETFSIPVPAPTTSMRNKVFGYFGWSPTKVDIVLLDKDGGQIGKEISLDVPDAEWVEVPGDGGVIDAVERRPPIVFDASTDDVAFVQIHSGWAQQKIALQNAVVQSPPAPPKIVSINPSGRWQIAVVSERFESSDEFEDACRSLHDFILRQTPFNDLEVGKELFINCLFWASGPGGIFDSVQDMRLLKGDNERVRKYVAASSANPRMVLVLAKMDERCGAGGSATEPAWISNKSSLREDWRQVALHELGHSFGLADEYWNNAQTTPEPTPLEPNVTDISDAADPGVPWAGLHDKTRPNNPTKHWYDPDTFPSDVIGTFEGARYMCEGRYRPSEACRMRFTTHQFCAVCARHIRKKLLTP